MALIELSMITGAIVGMAAETGFKALGQSEAAVRVRKRLRLSLIHISEPTRPY